MLEKLALLNYAYYVCPRIEQSLRKRRNPTNETNLSPYGVLLPDCFKHIKSVFISFKG